MMIKNMLEENIQHRIDHLRGKFGIYYKDLTTGEQLVLGNCDHFRCASLIKLPVLIEVFRRIYDKKLKREDRIVLREEWKVPSFGALTYMHDGLEVTIQDLYNLMMKLSDNTATNILIRYLGMERINKTMEEMGFKQTKINRLLFDTEKQDRGIQNYFSLMEMAAMLENIFQREMISEGVSREILSTMLDQQRNYIMGYYFKEKIPIAHKTDEDEDLLHNAGIVLCDRPFILCLASNDVDPRKAESLMRDVALMCYDHSNGGMEL